MDKIRAIIADDEPLARRGIRQMLDHHDDICIVAEAQDGLETVRALRQLNPDLIFLDIQMPALDGFEVLRRIGVQHMPSIIFVTAHDEFAVRAFDAQALDYLVKPLKKARFVQALERMRERRRSASSFELSRKLASLLEERDLDQPKQRIVVPTSKGDVIIHAEAIDWIEADGYYAAIHARNQRHLLHETLTSLLQRLDKTRFVRVHRSAIVNIDRVAELKGSPPETRLVLKDGTSVRVSRRRRSPLRRILRQLQTQRSHE